ncbi:MAG TPA: hypothetical protein VKB34_12675, partial [Povalibacter sp.]|nr:hypothetical protein [Povalibacter sp.]
AIDGETLAKKQSELLAAVQALIVAELGTPARFPMDQGGVPNPPAVPDLPPPPSRTSTIASAADKP